MYEGVFLMSIVTKHFFLAALGVVSTSPLWGMDKSQNKIVPEEEKIISFNIEAASGDYKGFGLDPINNLTEKQDLMRHNLIQEALEKDSIEAIEKLMKENPEITPFTRFPFYHKHTTNSVDTYNLFERAALLKGESIFAKLLTKYANSSKHSVGDIFNEDELFYHLTTIKTKEFFEQIKPFCKTREDNLTFASAREKLDKDLAEDTLLELAKKQTCTNQEIEAFKEILNKYPRLKNTKLHAASNKEHSLLFFAIESQNCEIAKILLANGVKPNEEELEFALQNYPGAPITKLLQEKSSPSEAFGTNAPIDAEKKPHSEENEWFKRLHQRPTGAQFLELPAKINALGFKTVNQKYIDLNQTSLLCDAAQLLDLASVQYLIDQGADVNEKIEIDGTVVNTPLYAAVLNFTGTDTCMYDKCKPRDTSIAMVKLLLEKGAKTTINTPVGKKMTTPLIAAIAHYPMCPDQNIELIKILKDNDADVSLQDSDGNSALHHAAKNLKDSEKTSRESFNTKAIVSDQAICKLLLHSKANLKLKNKQSLQPHQIAGCNSKEEWIKQLYSDENDIPEAVKDQLKKEEQPVDNKATDDKSPLKSTLYFGLSKNQLIGAGTAIVSLGALATWYLYTRITHRPFVPRVLNSLSSRTKLWWKWATTRSPQRLTTPAPLQFS